MKKALQVLVFPMLVVMLFGSSVLPSPAKSSVAFVDDSGDPHTPGTPDSPMCLPDSPCDPDIPNFR